MSKNKKKFYAVARGQKPGVYTEWFGENGAEVQVREFSGARYKKFSTLAEAQEFLRDFGGPGHGAAVSNGTLKPAAPERLKTKSGNSAERIEAGEALGEGKMVIYTDGGCLNNPGPGGYGAVLLQKSTANDEIIRKELSGGFRLTTNNRMELTACIEALKTLKQERCSVILFSDSQYVVNGITRGWAKRWRRKGWMRTKDNAAENPDLWAKLLDLCEKHEVEFYWVKGHAGNPENERCDELATQAANDPGTQSRDTTYESAKSTIEQKTLF